MLPPEFDESFSPYRLAFDASSPGTAVDGANIPAGFELGSLADTVVDPGTGDIEGKVSHTFLTEAIFMFKSSAVAGCELVGTTDATEDDGTPVR